MENKARDIDRKRDMEITLLANVAGMSKRKGKAKEDTGQGNRQVLGDIGNLEVARNVESKHISRPITRSYHAKLLASAQSAANVVLALEAQANCQESAQGKENFIQPALDNTAIVHKKRGVEETIDFDCERKFRAKSCRKVKTLTAEITAQSKAACGISTEPKDQQVDIDSDGANDELAVAEYLDDLYKFYKLTEVQSRIPDYMNSQHEINEKMRSITVDWLVDVHWRFKLMPETLYLTINILDRYLSLTDIPKTELQLVGISSMLIACKYEEIYPPQVKVFAKISDSAYTNDQIVFMENAILERLEWYLTVPTPYVFLVRFIRASEQPDHEDIMQMENIVFFLAELGLVHYQAILYCPSVIAAAAVYAARCTLNRNPFWTEILKHKTGYSIEQIIYCAKLLVSLQSSAADSKFNVVFQKYSSPDRGAVALLPPPRDLLNNFK